ncbi:amidohydrolase [soil metagenome]
MTDRSIVDTHVHLWDPARLRYDWLRDLPKLNRAFFTSDFQEASRASQIESFIFVECACDPSQNREEVAMVTAWAAHEPRLQGIVAQVALEKGAAIRDELAELAKNPLVKGVRRITQGEPDPNFCTQPAFVEGVRALAAFGFTCDLCITHSQLAATAELVRACPEVSFILDHLGKPDIRNGAREPWAKHLRELAALPNIWCKLSGVVTEADLTHWRHDDIAFFMEHALDCFGPDRLIYGGDWPVVTLATPYSRWVECTDRALGALPSTTRQKIYRDNALRFYRLEATPSESPFIK